MTLKEQARAKSFGNKMAKCIYKDEAGNKLFIDKDTYSARNVKGELISKYGILAMMKEKGISKKGLVEIYKGTKRKK